MRFTLVFPPPASPTYVPLGIASLVSYLRANVPQAQISVCDLNISLWCELAGRDDQGRALLDFMRGMSHGFLDPEAYGPHQSAWSSLAGQVAAIGRKGEKKRPARKLALERLFLLTGEAGTAQNRISARATSPSKVLLSFSPTKLFPCTALMNSSVLTVLNQPLTM